MFSILGRMLGSDSVIDKGLELLDDAFTTDIEKLEADTEATLKLIQAKTDAKVRLIESRSGYKIAQRILMLMFCIPFVFILSIGVLGILFGGVEIAKVKEAYEFASSFWLGQIVLTIVTFYFGGGVVESIKRKIVK